MKFLLKITSDNVSSYNRSTKGYEFIQTVESDKIAYDVVARLEDVDFFPQEDGKVLDGSGNEVFDPAYPDDFDFGDYRFVVSEYDMLDEHDDAHLLRAIDDASPWNIDEIKEIVV